MFLYLKRLIKVCVGTFQELPVTGILLLFHP